MTQYISFEEAAQILGMTRESVRLYVKRGLLIQGESYGAKKILKSSLDALMAKGYDVVQQTIAIESFREEMAAEKKQLVKLRKHLSAVKAMMKLKTKVYANYTEICHMLLLFVENNAEDMELSHREKDIASRFLSGSNLEEIADRYELTQERVRQIWNKAVKKLGRACRYTEVLDELIKVRKELEQHKKWSATLEDTLMNDKKTAEMLTAEVRIPEKLMGLSNAELSVRAVNCLRLVGFSDLYQLAFISKHQLARIRNFGRKSLDEIERLMDLYNISFNSPRSLQEIRIPKRESFVTYTYADIDNQYEEFKKQWK